MTESEEYLKKALSNNPHGKPFIHKDQVKTYGDLRAKDILNEIREKIEKEIKELTYFNGIHNVYKNNVGAETQRGLTKALDILSSHIYENSQITPK